MKRTFIRQHLAVVALAIGLIVGLAGCSLLQSENASVVTVVNDMNEPMAFLADGSGYPIDPNPEIPMDAFTSGAVDSGFLLESGMSVTLEKADLSGEYSSDEPLQLFLYEVRADTAYFADYWKLSYDDLEREDFRIKISGFSKH